MMSLLLLASIASAPAADAHRAHYEEAKRCYYIGDFFATTGIAGRASINSNNQDAGAQLRELYAPVMAYEGHKSGKASGEILAEMNEGGRTFALQNRQKLSGLKPAEQQRIFEELTEQGKNCSAVPALSTYSPSTGQPGMNPPFGGSSNGSDAIIARLDAAVSRRFNCAVNASISSLLAETLFAREYSKDETDELFDAAVVAATTYYMVSDIKGLSRDQSRNAMESKIEEKVKALNAADEPTKRELLVEHAELMKQCLGHPAPAN
jgi:hypothetical protein